MPFFEEEGKQSLIEIKFFLDLLLKDMNDEQNLRKVPLCKRLIHIRKGGKEGGRCTEYFFQRTFSPGDIGLG